MPHKHIYPAAGLGFPQTLHNDRHKLGRVQVPIVTISATFKHDLQQESRERSKTSEEVVFSRAHYSMAVAVMAQAIENKLTAWLVDPTNYVSYREWKTIRFVEKVGLLTARIKILKKLKDLFDNLVREKLPIAKAIHEPLVYVIERTKRPIISLHYEVGNVIAQTGKQVLQVITDPQVHDTYLSEAERKNIYFAVFDEATRSEFFAKAKKFNKEVEEERVVVTGPPVDPRIVKARKDKTSGDYKKRELRLVVSTGGLGTNKQEIEKILESLFPNLKNLNLRLIIHVGSHRDFRDDVTSLAQKYGIEVGGMESNFPVRMNFAESIIEANQNLIDYAFPWADGFITKPSGDMAYDAVAAGCFILSLDPWGSWEERIETIFDKKGILKKADVNNICQQLIILKENGWILEAKKNALEIEKLFLEGAKKIVELQQKISLNNP